MAITVDPTTGNITGAVANPGVSLPALTGSLVALNSSTAVILTTAGSEAYNSVNITVQNVDGSATVYLGGSDVTSSKYGAKLAAGASLALTGLPVNADLYAISSGSSNVAVLTVSK
jgi:uncharacterized secreted protein with C-terminal beta-propeller domain